MPFPGRTLLHVSHFSIPQFNLTAYYALEHLNNLNALSELGNLACQAARAAVMLPVFAYAVKGGHCPFAWGFVPYTYVILAQISGTSQTCFWMHHFPFIITKLHCRPSLSKLVAFKAAAQPSRLLSFGTLHSSMASPYS